jgi:hypothetical protein
VLRPARRHRLAAALGSGALGALRLHVVRVRVRVRVKVRVRVRVS